MHTDNDEEYRDIMMENYLKENNINHINRGAYNPQHQGTVEVFNKTIQDFLISAKGHQGTIFVELILLMIFTYIAMTEDIALPKSDHLN